MIWKEPLLGDICTNDLILWDDDYSQLLEKVSRILNISSFPSTKKNSVVRISKTGGHEEKAKTIPSTEGIFSPTLLTNLTETTDHLLYISNHNSISGLTHFTDYNCRIVYESLFSNLFEFEKGLRFYLTQIGESNTTFHSYAQKNLERKMKKSNKENIKSAQELAKTAERGLHGNAFESLSLTHIMNFCISSINGNGTLKENLRFLKKNPERINVDHNGIEAIRKLRNQIMHAKSNDGSSNELMHDFDEFRLFFERVLVLKEAFFELSNIIDGALEMSRARRNSWRLQTISNLSDDEIRSYFGI